MEIKKMLTKKWAILTASGISALPLLALADDSSIIEVLDDQVRPILNYLIQFIIGLAVFLFIWNLLKYVTAKDDEKKTEAKNAIVMGLIVIAIMLSVWGLVNLLVDALNLNNQAPNTFPEI